MTGDVTYTKHTYNLLSMFNENISDCFQFERSEGEHDYVAAKKYCEDEFNGTLLQYALLQKWQKYHELVAEFINIY